MIRNETRIMEDFCISRIARLGSDSRLLCSHISILTAIFLCWQHNGFREPFSVRRRKLMAYSKIASIATYHKCISELSTFGYIGYQPSYHPQKGSLVWWFDPE
jgi:hypothetical protein